MQLNELSNLQWLEPWHSAPPGLESELEREISTAHPLFGRGAISVGRRSDCDDVLFFLPDNSYPLAVAHLTWTGKRETNPEWPHTTFYSSLGDWVEKCMKPDHLEFIAGSIQDSRSVYASEVAELLRDIEERLAVAWINGDRSFIEQILADDWSVTDLTGRVLTKAEVLEEAFGSKDRKIVSMQIDDISVRSFGDWAIVTGRTQAAGEYQANVVEVMLRFTDVFAKRNGNWQAVASQATLISQ